MSSVQVRQAFPSVVGTSTSTNDLSATAPQPSTSVANATTATSTPGDPGLQFNLAESLAAAASSASSSYLGIGSSITPAADDQSFKLDLGMNNAAAGSASLLPTAFSFAMPTASGSASAAGGGQPSASSSSFTPGAAGFTFGGSTDSSATTAVALSGLDPSSFKVGNTANTFEFPTLPDGLLDEAPEYEYSAHTKANVFEAAQEYLADVDGAKVFDLENFDQTLAGFGGDETIWSFADGLDLVQPQQQATQLPPSTSTSAAQLSDPMLLNAIASAPGPHRPPGLPDDGLLGPHPSSSTSTPMGPQYALNYLQASHVSGSQTAPVYATSYPQPSQHQHQEQYSGGPAGELSIDDSMPSAKRRKGASPRTAPIFNETPDKSSSSYLQQAGMSNSSQALRHPSHNMIPLGPPVSSTPLQSGYPSSYVPNFSGIAAVGGTPLTSSSRSRMTSWQGSPYAGANGTGEWGSIDSHPGAHVGPSPDLSGSAHAGFMPSGGANNNSASGGNGNGTSTVPSGGGYTIPRPPHSIQTHGPGGPARHSASTAASMGLVPIVGVPVGPGSTIAVAGPSTEIVHSLGQALDATADADGVARCPYPNCHKTFAKNRTYNLKAHLRSHSQLKPFACASCPRAFSRKHDLERHARVHSGDKPYICEVCGRGFPRSDALRRHWRVEKECGLKAAELEAMGNGAGTGDSTGGESHSPPSHDGNHWSSSGPGAMSSSSAGWSHHPGYGLQSPPSPGGVGEKRKR